ncbi:MAG: hypothetical protein AAGB11_18010 [Pseudomonadota bacterium]
MTNSFSLLKILNSRRFGLDLKCLPDRGQGDGALMGTVHAFGRDSFARPLGKRTGSCNDVEARVTLGR